MYKLSLSLVVFLLAFHVEAVKVYFSNSHIHGLVYQKSLISDFEFRDKLPKTEIPKADWKTCCGKYGPWPFVYPLAVAPVQYDKLTWLRDRVIAVAKKYIGLPYMHKHIPEAGGLDCSNLTSWVYNFGLGISFTSNIRKQAYIAGRKLAVSEKKRKGDLLYF